MDARAIFAEFLLSAGVLDWIGLFVALVPFAACAYVVFDPRPDH